MNLLIQFITASILIPSLDYIAFTKILKDAYFQELQLIGRIKDGGLSAHMGYAAIVYVLMALGIVFYVMPLTKGRWSLALVHGGLFGFVIFGIYDFTNLAILSVWSTRMALLDLSWGVFVCAVTTLVVQLVDKRTVD